ncbi:aldehyde ferredoxin oxidoreductase [uncultured Senegalimassilia sp.]|uniref:aldehyde ferredoxin oxidoreductase n=1 Tax=uncultured Senegalimassilia sp. TaxID=1714350 RepID=UPI0025E673ED|nr:aldehyde ferredoxin oxidoreductase [uncultured Senegalimassilia sp.]
MADKVSYGWTGKILRVNLTTGSITTESTDPYKEYIGGMGLANKVMYDEVPAGTDPLGPDNKIVFAVGPLTASGVPLGGRCTISTLSCFTTDNLIVDGHCGGMIGAKMKLAGYDAIILEGASDKPVYLNIKDDQVEIKDASFVWGMGTRSTTEALNRLEGTSACVAAIGPAGENLLPYSCIMNARNHSAGAGLGAVMGSKKCKALVVEGNGSVNVKDPQAVADLSDYMLRELIGSNNNHVVPSTQQEWAEYYNKGSRWNAHKGLYWTQAEGGPIETGEPKPGEINTVGKRCLLIAHPWMLGAEAEKYTIKTNGCHGCPIHCYADLRVGAAKDASGYQTSGNACMANAGYTFMNNILGQKLDDEKTLYMNVVFTNLMDDLGIWCNYGQLYRDLGYCIKEGVFKRVLPESEYNAIDWDKLTQGDPTWISQVLRLIMRNDTEISYIAHGPIVWCPRWGVEGWFDDKRSSLINYRGWPYHHGVETFGQVGGLMNMVFNRDPMIHSAVNFSGCGLPIEVKKSIAAEIWGGEEACDPDKNYTPMNDAKANFTWWSIVTDVLHDSLTLCNWVWPMAMSPTKARDYRGDLDMEAKFYKAVTGEDVTTDELYKRAAKIMTLQRAMTVRGMKDKDGKIGCNDLHGVHDVPTQWIFTMDPDKQPFTEGTTKMEAKDFDSGLHMLYSKFGWDEELGCPTADCLDAYGMDDVKAELQSLNLLP